MDIAAENDGLEDRWQRMFTEFQKFQAQRRELRNNARGELEAREKEIDGEILRIRSDQTKQIEAIKEEANAEQRHIEEQAAIEIKRLQDEAQRRITEVQKETEKDVEILKVDIETQTQELEHKRTSRKRKHEEDERQIESEFSSRLKRLDRQLRASALPVTPPPSATREVPADPLQVHNSSEDPPSLADSIPREEPPESRQSTRTPLPPLCSSEQGPPSRTTLAPDTAARVAKKHRFEGFAKDGCITCKKRYRLCDCTKPICGKCKADGRQCIWPQPPAPQQPSRHDGTSAANGPRGEAEAPRAPSLRPLHTDFRPRAHSDLLPAFAYDACRRPSQRLVRLDHSADQVRSYVKERPVVLLEFVADDDQLDPPGRGQDTGPDSGDSSAGNRSVSTAVQTVPPRVPSVPPTQQPARTPLPSSSRTAPKTITYDEVFANVQNKDSREKHYIVEWPHNSNRWYILRCDKHDMNFGEHPFTSARLHLYSEAHGFVERVQDTTVRELGVLVTGCDAKRAVRSNLAYKKALADGYKPKGHGRKRRRRADGGSKPVANTKSVATFGIRPSAIRSSAIRPSAIRPRPTHGILRPASTSAQFDGIIDPIPGEVYEGAQRQSSRGDRQWHLVVCLPLDDWTTIGIDGTLKESLLSKSMPSCYQRIFLMNPEPVSVDWALDFQINGPRAKDRKFPCLILRPGLEIPPWGQKFSIPSDERFLAWIGASSLRRRWFKHPWKTLPSSTKGIEDGQDVARKFRRRLEAYRASRGEPRLGVNTQGDRTVVETDDADTSDTHGRSSADDSGTTQENEASSRRLRGNAKGVGPRQERGTHAATEDNIVVISSEHDDSESSLSPVPSEYDGDEADSSYSSESTSSDTRNASADPTIAGEDFDIGDYNDPPVSPSSTSQSGADSGRVGPASDEPVEISRDDPVGTPSAVDGLRAIQAELIPGYYEEGNDRVEQSTASQERSDSLLLFPGLATRSTHEEEENSDV